MCGLDGTPVFIGECRRFIFADIELGVAVIVAMPDSESADDVSATGLGCPLAQFGPAALFLVLAINLPALDLRVEVQLLVENQSSELEL